MVRLINISADTSYDVLMANTSQQAYNANGKPIQYIHYAPYGELIANQQTIGYDERFKFTGKERDWETGYDYFGARYYDFRKGIWNSVDPLADKNISNSPYMYCGGNPIMLVDPDGRDEWNFDECTNTFINNRGWGEMHLTIINAFKK